MDVLLLDDDGNKLRHVSNYLKEIGHTCEQVNDTCAMKTKVSQRKFDMVIVDLVVPMANEEVFEGMKNGYEAVNYLRTTSDAIFYPKKILALTRYLNKDVVWELNALGITGIKYDGYDGNWKRELKKELDYISVISIKKADIVILTVVENEKQQMEKVFNWKYLNVEEDPLQYYYCEIENKRGYPLTLIHCYIGKKGVVASSQATSRVIELFEPDYILMCGIAAGRKDKVNFGDIIVAESAVDFASGSVEENENGMLEFIPDTEIVAIDATLVKPFRNYKEDNQLLRKIRDEADYFKNYNNDIHLHIGKIATGPAVIKSESFVTNYIKSHNRQYIAIDMETYGVYYTSRILGCRCLSIKCITDYGDQNKNDDYQKYAALVASNMVKHYIINDYQPKTFE